MIKVKITKQGGYVVGDGKCPLDPDEFYAMFAHRILAAQAEGLTEIGFTDEEVAKAAQKMQTQWDKVWSQAEAKKMPNKTSAKQIIDGLFD
jgi:acetyl-CoA carboxylase carboxyltransferase component